MGPETTADPPAFASVPKRAAAIIVDTIVMAVLLAAPTFWIFSSYGTQDPTGGYQVTGAPAFLMFSIWLVVWQAYHILFEGWTATTPGKRLFSLKVIDGEGATPGWRPIVGRNLLRVVDGIFVYLVGAVAAATSERGQRFGDRMAGTFVVETG